MENVLNEKALDRIVKENFYDLTLEEVFKYTNTREKLAEIIRKNFGGKFFVILQGAAGSGKSTLCNVFSAIFGDDAIVCPDSIREMCGAIKYDDDGNAISISQDINKVVFEIFYKIVATRIAMGKPVVVDATHTTAKTMSRYKELLADSGYVVEVHKCECSLEKILERNTKRGYKNVPEEVVRGMYAKLSTFKPEDWYTYVVHNTEGE